MRFILAVICILQFVSLVSCVSSRDRYRREQASASYGYDDDDYLEKKLTSEDSSSTSSDADVVSVWDDSENTSTNSADSTTSSTDSSSTDSSTNYSSTGSESTSGMGTDEMDNTASSMDSDHSSTSYSDMNQQVATSNPTSDQSDSSTSYGSGAVEGSPETKVYDFTGAEGNDSSQDLNYQGQEFGSSSGGNTNYTNNTNSNTNIGSGYSDGNTGSTYTETTTTMTTTETTGNTYYGMMELKPVSIKESQLIAKMMIDALASHPFSRQNVNKKVQMGRIRNQTRNRLNTDVLLRPVTAELVQRNFFEVYATLEDLNRVERARDRFKPWRTLHETVGSGSPIVNPYDRHDYKNMADFYMIGTLNKMKVPHPKDPECKVNGYLLTLAIIDVTRGEIHWQQDLPLYK